MGGSIAIGEIAIGLIASGNAGEQDKGRNENRRQTYADESQGGMGVPFFLAHGIVGDKRQLPGDHKGASCEDGTGGKDPAIMNGESRRVDANRDGVSVDFTRRSAERLREKFSIFLLRDGVRRSR